MDRSSLFDSYNAGYAQALYEEYLRDPQSVDPSWRRLFGSGEAAEAGLITVEVPGGAPPSSEQLRAAMAAGELVDAYRLHGHWAADLDPLDRGRPSHPMLDPAFHGITVDELRAVPAALVGLHDVGDTMADVLEWLRTTYTGTIGYEFEHLEDPARREWLRERIEAGVHRQPLGTDEQARLLARLSEVEGLEQFLHRAYLGQKRFSVEGTDMLVPMLDLAIELAAAAGAEEVVLGMAHRGRLNVLAHVLGRSYATIITEFEGHPSSRGTTGDVKYHLGAQGTYATASGKPLTVTLAPNPSHLEFVSPIVEGIARAKQGELNGRDRRQNPAAVLPVLIHGDAAFSGQGVVAETLNLAQLDGYRTGGTLHLTANNQVGFTTDPVEGRSTRYSSDLARGYRIPIFHVNADDPAACLAVVRLAHAYRDRFESDVLVDLIGYRRYGHNEGDEPSYTQPRMYEVIGEHPSVRKLWAAELTARGIVSEQDADDALNAAHQRLTDAQDEVKRRVEGGGAPESNGRLRADDEPFEAGQDGPAVETALPADRLLALDGELHTWPPDFQVHPKLARQLERRRKLLAEDGPIDWAHAEALAFASLAVEGSPVRLSGQDTERGTFSQRHLVLHDVEDGNTYTPLAHLSEALAPFEVYNSPLSEVGAMGFEYGYSLAAPAALVLWEAQFGDFANVAQVIIDQFIASGHAKWGQESGLVLLLPHGYEGQGPEHSSARIERFLQLAAENNLRIADCSTPAQYFHLLRRQARLAERRPLVLFTPKSLLRHPQATSRLDELANGSFQFVIDDPDARERAGDITRVVFCTGKVYYDLIASEARAAAPHVAVVRVEQLYPFAGRELAAVLEGYPSFEEVVWAQEEPENMGAWDYMQERLGAMVGDRPLGYVGRPRQASPAEGYASAHAAAQARLVEAAFTAPVSGAAWAPTPQEPQPAQRQQGS